MKKISDVRWTIGDVMSLTVVNRGNNHSLSYGHKPPFVFVRAFFEGHICGVFLNTWVGRGRSREEARHTHGCARCEYVARTSRLRVSGCMYRTLRRWRVLTRTAHLRCSYSLDQCKCVQVRWTLVYFGRCWVLVSAHMVRGKCEASTCSVKSD